MRGECVLFAGGDRLACHREQFVAPRRLADDKFQVLREEVAFVDQALGLLPHLFEIPTRLG